MLKLEIENPDNLRLVCHALSTHLRLQMLQLLQAKRMSCLEISKQLDYPLSTITANVKILENAGLVLTESVPAKNGFQRICSIVYSDIHIYFAENLKRHSQEDVYEIDLPIGSYMKCCVSPTCGYVTKTGIVAPQDQPSAFYHPLRLEAQLIWFRKGWVEYFLPLKPDMSTPLREIRMSMEICSEAPGYHLNWPSDITVWLEGIEIGTYQSPSDFGGIRGAHTPAFWPLQCTQYGLLTRWVVGEFETTINYEKISQVCIKDIATKQQFLTLRIGIKDDAAHVGGINLFGHDFGNYPQNIKIQLIY